MDKIAGRFVLTLSISVFGSDQRILAFKNLIIGALYQKETNYFNLNFNNN
jgi:hypothetical protein